MKNPRIGFIGLGIMGRSMAQNLLKAGFQVAVYNRSKPPVDLLVSKGASAASSPKAVAERSDVVITMVTDSEAVKDVVLGKGGVIEGAREGLVLIDMSTISPSDHEERLGGARGEGGEDARRSRERRRHGRQGGDADDNGGRRPSCLRRLPACPPAMGKKVVHMGGTGAGQLTKLANQILVACNMIGVCECLNFAKKSGLDVGKLIDSLSAGAASSWALVNLGPRMAKRDFAPGFKVKLLQKDLRYVSRGRRRGGRRSARHGAGAPALQAARGEGAGRGGDAGPAHGRRGAFQRCLNPG